MKKEGNDLVYFINQGEENLGKFAEEDIEIIVEDAKEDQRRYDQENKDLFRCNVMKSQLVTNEKTGQATRDLTNEVSEVTKGPGNARVVGGELQPCDTLVNFL